MVLLVFVNFVSFVWFLLVVVDSSSLFLFQTRQGKEVAVLAVAISGGKKKDKLYQIYRPNTGLSPKMESLSEIKKKYKKVRIPSLNSSLYLIEVHAALVSLRLMIDLGWYLLETGEITCLRCVLGDS